MLIQFYIRSLPLVSSVLSLLVLLFDITVIQPLVALNSI